LTRKGSREEAVPEEGAAILKLEPMGIQCVGD
jgi:hypothetical protein